MLDDWISYLTMSDSSKSTQMLASERQNLHIRVQKLLNKCQGNEARLSPAEMQALQTMRCGLAAVDMQLARQALNEAVAMLNPAPGCEGAKKKLRELNRHIEAASANLAAPAQECSAVYTLECMQARVAAGGGAGAGSQPARPRAFALAAKPEKGDVFIDLVSDDDDDEVKPAPPSTKGKGRARK